MSMITLYKQDTLKITLESFRSKIPMSACFVFHYVQRLEETLQVLSDLAISNDGVPGTIRDASAPQFVKLYICHPDDIGMLYR